MLARNPDGNYRFLAAKGHPFSAGTVADPGFDLVHATFEHPLALDKGLEAAARHLVKAARPVRRSRDSKSGSPSPHR